MDPVDEAEVVEERDVDEPRVRTDPAEIPGKARPWSGDGIDTDDCPRKTTVEGDPNDRQEIADGRDVDAPGDGESSIGGLDKEGVRANVGIVWERNPLVLWRMWELIILQFFKADVPKHKQLAGLALLLGVEMAMLLRFGQVPTEPGVLCIGQRYDHEFERRRQLAAVVRRELQEMHGGFRGFLRWFVGKGQVNTRKLETSLHAEAQGLGPDYSSCSRGYPLESP